MRILSLAAIIRWFFRRKPEPKPGERWRFKDNPLQDPWGGGVDRHTADILDVREGWVRYSIGGSLNDERMKMDSFLFCYAFDGDQ